MPDLCDLDDLKTWLKVSDDSQDDLLQRLITSTSQDFLNRIRRVDFMPSGSYTEHISLHDSHEIFLRRYPVNQLHSVTINDIVIPIWSDLTPETPGWFFDDSLDPENRQKVTLMAWHWQSWGLTWAAPWRSIYRPPPRRIVGSSLELAAPTLLSLRHGNLG